MPSLSVDSALATGSSEDARCALEARIWTDLEIDTLHEMVHQHPDQIQEAIDGFREKVRFASFRYYSRSADALAHMLLSPYSSLSAASKTSTRIFKPTGPSTRARSARRKAPRRATARWTSSTSLLSMTVC